MTSTAVGVMESFVVFFVFQLPRMCLNIEDLLREDINKAKSDA